MMSYFRVLIADSRFPETINGFAQAGLVRTNQ
jgi:hypothetical protein